MRDVGLIRNDETTKTYANCFASGLFIVAVAIVITIEVYTSRYSTKPPNTRAQ